MVSKTEGPYAEVSDLPHRGKLTDQPILELPDRPSLDDSWTEKGLVTSPDQENTKIPTSTTNSSGSNIRPAPLDLEEPGSILSASEDTVLGGPPSSPSKRRWDTIRHHVIPSDTSSVESVPDIPAVPPRPSTPKLYRFGQKKAFRQVVETAQTQHVGETKRFSEAVQRACWECRFGETTPLPKPEREPTLGAVGSSLHLPFMMSNTTLQTPSSSNASVNQISNRIGGLKRPQSIQSLAQSSRIPTPIARIARALTSTTSFNRPRDLPHERLILSTLLLPFLCPHPDSQTENEHATAVETFEYIVRTWKAISVEASS